MPGFGQVIDPVIVIVDRFRCGGEVGAGGVLGNTLVVGAHG
jgi:hypothetical protein